MISKFVENSNKKIKFYFIFLLIRIFLLFSLKFKMYKTFGDVRVNS